MHRAYKRDPVPGEPGIYHLSRLNVAIKLNRPTLRDRTSSPLIMHKHKIPGIFGLSTPEVYPLLLSPNASVSSYLTFSPLPESGGYFLWHLLSSFGCLPVRKQSALCCPDFPLLPPSEGSSDRSSRCTILTIYFQRT